MQYILTQEEYDALQRRIQSADEKYKVTINYLCRLVADNKPLTCYPGSTLEPAPWGCRKSKDYEWYCDNCPVVDYCGMTKHFSK